MHRNRGDGLPAGANLKRQGATRTKFQPGSAFHTLAFEESVAGTESPELWVSLISLLSRAGSDPARRPVLLRSVPLPVKRELAFN
jgi:hypothetical protein